MKQATARQQPHNYENDRAEQYARYRRRDHANLESMLNLMISAITAETGIEMPPKCRHLLSAIQGAHGGGEVIEQEFERDYLTLAAQLQFTGSDDARRSRVRDWIDALENWQIKNYLLVTIIKGGKVLGYRDDGTPITSKTKFIDHVMPPADAAVMRARASVQWRGDEKATPKIKPHPGRALAAQVPSAVKRLSRHPDYQKPEEKPEEPEVSVPFNLSEYVKSRQDFLFAENTRILERVTDGEPEDVEEIDKRLATLDVYYAHSCAKLKKTYEATHRELSRLRHARLEKLRQEMHARIDEDTAETAPETAHASGSAYTCNFSAPDDFEEVVIGEGGGGYLPTPSTPEMPAKTQDSDPEMLECALEWARQGMAVIPVHTVIDGICSCLKGSECRSAGKHPRIKEWEKAATTDEAQIARWWAKWPHSNIGGAMGVASGMFALDVDPKSGGDASLSDLIMAHGDEWLKTRVVETGSLGFHFYFTYPADVHLRNSASKIAPGVDIRGEGGQVVLPPSLHLSGRRYSLKDAAPIQPAPAWLIEELTRKPDQKPSVVVDFQERRAAARGGGTIGDGERNDRLFRVGCGIWGKGQAEDLTDLHAQLLQVNAERCSPSLTDAEVAEIVGSINRYPRGVPVPAEAYT